MLLVGHPHREPESSPHDMVPIEVKLSPYGAPNANAHVERFHRSLREEALSHFIFLNARHILLVCRKDVNCYNGARPSQALHAIPDPYPELTNSQTETGRVVAIPVLGGVQHDYRRAA
jgi:transposase InsO family protein